MTPWGWGQNCPRLRTTGLDSSSMCYKLAHSEHFCWACSMCQAGGKRQRRSSCGLKLLVSSGLTEMCPRRLLMVHTNVWLLLSNGLESGKPGVTMWTLICHSFHDELPLREIDISLQVLWFLFREWLLYPGLTFRMDACSPWNLFSLWVMGLFHPVSPRHLWDQSHLFHNKY